ncbi:MAG TPA: class I SAM-dependent methyltransferase [Edaphobacter sp.]|nr:class I SAM-dependent methyltransferase [Edaphobacter sp.]
MNQCRNCGATNLRDLGFIGALAPFFLKRVLRAELKFRKASAPHKRVVQRLTELPQRFFSRIHHPVVAVELQSCLNCSFIQTKYAFPDDALGNLYVDYRAKSYNQERSHYEPGYAQIAEQVGTHTEGGLNRVEALTNWLTSKVTLNACPILDYGGADGKFLPDLPCSKFVYEISNIEPVPGVTRIAKEADLQQYDYVQLSHVLEHVPQPLQMTRHVASFIKPGGYLLVEVPQDLDTNVLQQLQSGDTDHSITIHEHINFYSLLAIQKLLEGTGLEIIALDAIPVKTAITGQFFIRGLARRPVA